MTLTPWRRATVATAILVSPAIAPGHTQVEAPKGAAITLFTARIPDGVLDDLRHRLA